MRELTIKEMDVVSGALLPLAAVPVIKAVAVGAAAGGAANSGRHFVETVSSGEEHTASGYGAAFVGGAIAGGVTRGLGGNTAAAAGFGGTLGAAGEGLATRLLNSFGAGDSQSGDDYCSDGGDYN